MESRKTTTALLGIIALLLFMLVVGSSNRSLVAEAVAQGSIRPGVAYGCFEKFGNCVVTPLKVDEMGRLILSPTK
jgi:hypothetical protein